MGDQRDSNEGVTYPLVIGFYFFVSIALITSNKVVLSGSTLSLAAPMFIVWYQLLITLICLVVLGALSSRFGMLGFLPKFEFQFDKAYQLLQLSGIFLAMMVFNNLCLYYVEVSFYQVARSLTVLFNVLLSYQMYGVPTSMQANRACGVVFIGFIIGCIGEQHLSIEGVVFGIVSSVFVALYSIHVKNFIPVVDGNHWKLMMYTTLISLIFLIPIILALGEYPVIANSPVIYQFDFWMVMTALGLLSFLINVAIFLQIRFTTPLIHNISGTVKAALQTLISLWYFGNRESFLGLLGVAMVVAGSYWYSSIRLFENQQEPKQKEEKEGA